MIKFRCPHCDQKLGVPDEYAGKRVRCSKCSQACQVPAASSPEPQPTQTKTQPVARASVSPSVRPAAQQQAAAKPQMPQPRPAVTKAAAVPVQAEVEDIPMEEELNPFAGLQFDEGGPNSEVLAAARQERYKHDAKTTGSRTSAGREKTAGGGVSGLAAGAGKIPLAIAASIAFMFGICIVWTFIEWFTGGLFLLSYVFPFAIAAAGASGLIMFTQERNFALGALAFLLALGGIVTGKIMIARWVVMKEFNTPFAALPWEQQRTLIEDPTLVYNIGTVQLWKEDQFDETVAKSLIIANTGFESDEDYDEEVYDEDTEASSAAENETVDETEGEEDAADSDQTESLEQDRSSLPDSSSAEEESPREYEAQHQAVCALIEPWQFADKQKAFEQYYDQYQQCSTDWLLVTPIGFIVALLMTFSCWDLIVIPASLGTAFKMGIGSDA